MGLELQDALRVAGPVRAASTGRVEATFLLFAAGCAILYVVSHDDWGIVKWTGFVASSVLFGAGYAINMNGDVVYPLDKARWFLFSLMSVVGVAYVVVSVAKKAIQQNKGIILLWWAITLSVQIGTCIPFVWKKLVEVVKEPVINILVEVIYLIPVWVAILAVIGLFTLVIMSQQE